MAQCEWVYADGKRCSSRAVVGDLFCPIHRYEPDPTVGTVGHGGGVGEAGAGTGLARQAQQYGEAVAEAATTAKDYVSEKADVVGEKFRDLRNKDYGQMADDAKQYARQNPGQALLISAAAGFVLGLLVRGNRR